VSQVASRFWPLIASVGFHGALATALVVHGAVAKLPTLSHTSVRDIWIGETLEAAQSDSTSSTEETAPLHESVPDSPAAPPSNEAVPQPKAAKAVAPLRSVVQRTPDSEDSLAQRILAYRPKSVTTEEKDTEAGHAEVVRGKTGGMAGKEDDQSARGFAKAFTRALPAANTGDPVWADLPLGHAGFVRVSVTVGADGSIDQVMVLDKPRKPPSHLARLVDRTIILLRGGRFALTNGGAGTETLRLDVTLSERPMESGPLALGFETPTAGNPGRAYFQLASGRFIDTKVSIEPK
jgi:hypothetical protein